MSKKFLLISGLVIVGVLVLAGCNELGSETTGDTSMVELVNYNVYTYDYSWTGYEKIADGFSHNENGDGYIVEGTIKNKAGKMLDRIRITANFYDRSNNLLNTLTDTVYSLANTYTSDFEIKYSKDNYYMNVASVKFDFSLE